MGFFERVVGRTNGKRLTGLILIEGVRLMVEGSVIIRQARESDVDAIIAVTEEVFGPVSIDAMIESMIGAPASWIEIKGNTIRKELADNLSGAFIAELDGELVGYATTSVNKIASRGIINNLAVRAKAQGHGVGRKLLTAALEYFRSLKLEQAKIETLTINEVGRHLYPSLGFKEVAQQVHYIMKL